MKRAFTLIELVFVIVVIGILAAIAAPRLFATRDDALLTKAKADISSIRSAIINRHNTDMLRGVTIFPASLETSPASNLFDGVLQNGIRVRGTNETSGWTKSGNDYTFTLGGQATTFTYNPATGAFNCVQGVAGTTDASERLCQQLTQ